MGTHKRLSGSKAERFIFCPGSVALDDRIPEDREADSSEYSKEGTAAHELAAACLINGDDAWLHIGETGADEPEIKWTDEMADAVQQYVDFCREVAGKGGAWWTEVSIDNEEIHPDFGGTSDRFGVYQDDDWTIIHVIDYKHGIGVQVDVVGCAQLQYYAFGVLKKLKDLKYPKDMPGLGDRSKIMVRMTIVQPRGHHPDGPIRTTEMTLDALEFWADFTLIPALFRAGEEEFNPGEHCRFARCILPCPKATEAYKFMENRGMLPPDGLSDEQLTEELAVLQLVEKRIKALKKVTRLRLDRAGGEDLGIGWKLVRSRADRVWKAGADKSLEEHYGENAYTTPELKSPAQVEKLPGGASFTAELAYMPEAGLTIAPDDDSRERVKIATGRDQFKDLTS